MGNVESSGTMEPISLAGPETSLERDSREVGSCTRAAVGERVY